MGGECGMFGGRKKCVQVCGWELEQICLERLGLVGDSIKIYFKETGGPG
jgi:hypothetical protein